MWETNIFNFNHRMREEMKQVSLKVDVVFYVEIRVSEQAATSAATARSKLLIILPMHLVLLLAAHSVLASARNLEQESSL